MREVRLIVDEFEGYAVTVSLDGGIEKYKDAFLRIYNNVRENRELVSIKNYDDSNDVTVYCRAESKDALVDFLEYYGEIKSVEAVLLYQACALPEYDLDRYDEAVLIPYSE